MKKLTLLLIICLALSNCSTSIESKSTKQILKISFWRFSISLSADERDSNNYDNFIQTQTIIREELLTRLRGRVTDIVPQLSERVKSVINLPETIKQEPWTYGIEPQVLV